MFDDKKDGRVEWVEAYLKRELSEFEANAVVLICKTMRRGPYDFASTFRKAEWSFPAHVPAYKYQGIATYATNARCVGVLLPGWCCATMTAAWRHAKLMRR